MKEIGQYLASRTADSQRTQEVYRHWLTTFAAFCQSRSALAPEQITAQHFEEYRKWLTWQPNHSGKMNKPNTVFLALRLARSFLRWLGNSSGEVILSRPNSQRIELLTPQELARVLTPMGNEPLQLRDFLVLVIIAATNLGPTGCCALDVDSELGLDQHLENHRLAYLRRGRPPSPCPALFLAHRRRLNVPALRAILLKAGLSARLGRRLSCRLLRQSYKAQSQSRSLAHLFYL